MNRDGIIKAEAEIRKLIVQEEAEIRAIKSEPYGDDMKMCFIEGHKQNIAVFQMLLKKYYSN
jgi:hypothetical protein